MCLYPRLMKNPRYRDAKTQRWIPKEVEYVPVSCGICKECRKKKSNEWRTRLALEIEKNPKKCLFVTLTFNEDSLSQHTDAVRELNDEFTENDIAAFAVQKFIKRWVRKYKKSMRHWLIAELGDEQNARLHLHGLIWLENGMTTDVINERWQNGFVFIGEEVNMKTINYIVKYVTKVHPEKPEFIGKIFCSKGIGHQFFTEFNIEKHKYKKEKTEERIRLNDGRKVAMPQYFRKKMWNDDEREQLWKNRVRKHERWINGERIDISTQEGEGEYYRCLDYYRRKALEMGYLEPDFEKDEKKYREKVAYLNNLTDICGTEFD